MAKAEESFRRASKSDAPVYAPKHYDRAEKNLKLARDLAKDKDVVANMHARESINASERAIEASALRKKIDLMGTRITLLQTTSLKETEQSSTSLQMLQKNNRQLTSEAEKLYKRNQELGRIILKLQAGLAESSERVAKEAAQNIKLHDEISSLVQRMKNLDSIKKEKTSSHKKLVLLLDQEKVKTNDLSDQVKKFDNMTSKLTTTVGNNKKTIAEQKAAISKITQEIESLRTKNKALSQQNKELTSANAGLESEIGTLKKFAARTASEIQKFEEQTDKLASELRDLTSEQVKLRSSNDKLILTFVDQILFQSGSSDIQPQGKAVLKKVARLLREYSDRQIQIGGHTDNRQIQTERYASNWDLSASRAINVLRVILESEPLLAPSRFVASGFSKYDPIASNLTPEGRKQNRRVEIVILRGKFE